MGYSIIPSAFSADRKYSLEETKKIIKDLSILESIIREVKEEARKEIGENTMAGDNVNPFISEIIVNNGYELTPIRKGFDQARERKVYADYDTALDESFAEHEPGKPEEESEERTMDSIEAQIMTPQEIDVITRFSEYLKGQEYN